LTKKVGADAKAEIEKQVNLYKSAVEQMKAESVTAEQVKSIKDDMDAAVAAVKAIVEKQGSTVTEILMNIGNAGGSPQKSKNKTIAQKLHEDKEDIRKIFHSRTGVKEYMLVGDGKGGVF